MACFSASMAFISFSRRLRLSFSADARLRLPTALNFSVSIASDCAAVLPQGGVESQRVKRQRQRASAATHRSSRPNRTPRRGPVIVSGAAAKQQPVEGQAVPGHSQRGACAPADPSHLPEQTSSRLQASTACETFGAAYTNPAVVGKVATARWRRDVANQECEWCPQGYWPQCLR